MAQDFKGTLSGVAITGMSGSGASFEVWTR